MSEVETFTLETADGEKKFTSITDFMFLSYGGFGLPNVNYITERGFRQHGETVVDTFLQYRELTVELFSPGKENRQEYWEKRAELHDILRVNRGGPLILTLYREDGRRSIAVRPDPGMVFDPKAELNDWAIREEIKFTAFDPLWYDPDPASVYHMVNGASVSMDVQNEGNWQADPIITIDGPYTSIILTHDILGGIIELVDPITVGQQRIISLRSGDFSITDANGVDKFSELDSESDLIDFKILGHPQAPSGVNTINIETVGYNGAQTKVTFSFYHRYIGT